MPISPDLYHRLRLDFQRWSPLIYGFCDRYKSVIKFTIAGGLATVTDLFLLYLFHDPLGLEIVLATTLAFIISFLVSFSLQKFWTFRDYSRERAAGQLFLYILNAVIGLNLNGFLMHLLVKRYGVWYLLAQVMVIAVIGAGNFVVYKFIIFRKKHHDTVSR